MGSFLENIDVGHYKERVVFVDLLCECKWLTHYVNDLEQSFFR